MNTFQFNFTCHIYIKFHKLPGYKSKYEIAAVEGNDQFPAFILPKHGIIASASTVKNSLSGMESSAMMGWYFVKILELDQAKKTKFTDDA